MISLVIYGTPWSLKAITSSTGAKHCVRITKWITWGNQTYNQFVKSKVIVCDTPSYGSDHLWLIWKESIQNCRCYRADTAARTDGRTDGRMDRRTDRRTEWNQYTPQQLRCSGGIIMNRKYKFSDLLAWIAVTGHTAGILSHTSECILHDLDDQISNTVIFTDTAINKHLQMTF